ncbi:MAG: hypothetical protein ABSD53_18065 [Terriglobales bacterium]|jgi:hypothetical protein
MKVREELPTSFGQGRCGPLVFADDLDSERMVHRNLSFTLCESKSLAGIFAYRFSVSFAIALARIRLRKTHAYLGSQESDVGVEGEQNRFAYRSRKGFYGTDDGMDGT